MKGLNLLKTFWKVVADPRNTVKKLIEEERFKSPFIISFLVGFTYWLGVSASANQGANPDVNLYDIITGSFLLGGCAGLIFLFFFAFVIRFTTKKFRKKDIDLKHLTLAISWGSSPMLIILIVTLIEVIILGKSFFMIQPDLTAVSKGTSYLIRSIEFLKPVITIVTFFTLYRSATSVMHPEPDSIITVSRVKSNRKKRKKK